MSDSTFFDGEYEIVYSNNFIIYEDKLEIRNIPFIKDSKIIFSFLTGEKQDMNKTVSIENKTVTYAITGFNNPLGMGITKRDKIGDIDNNKELYIGFIFSKLSDKEESTAREVKISFYVK